MRFFKCLPIHALRVGFVLLVVAALLVSVLRFVQPLAHDFRDELAQILSQRLGYQVSIGGLRLSSSGLAPRLTLERVVLSHQDDEDEVVALSLRAMELDLNLLASLRTLAPQFDALTLVGARLVLERFVDGRLRIIGLGAVQSDDPRALELFLGQGRLNLVDAEVLYVDHGRGGKLARLVDMRLHLHNAGTHHQLDLTARLVPPDPIISATPQIVDSAASGNELHLVAMLDGPPADPWSWSGRLYTKLVSADPGLLMPAGHWAGHRLETGQLELEAWQRIERGRLEHALVKIDLDGVQLSAPLDRPHDADSMPLTLEPLQMLARVRPAKSGWQVRVSDLDTRLNGVALSGLNLNLRFSQDWTVSGLSASADQLDLAGIAQISPWALPEPIRTVRDHAPQGQVRNLNLDLAPSSTPPWRWTLSADLTDLGWDQHAAIPGIKGLNATLSANQDGGALYLDSAHLLLDLAPLFNLPIALNQFSAQLDWRHDPDGAWHLSAHKIALETADLAGRAQFALDLPADGASPFLDLRARFHDADAASVRTYLPAGILEPELVDWLDTSIVSGRVRQGDVIFRGTLADYPFRAYQGRFELLLAFEDLLLDYQTDWPPITSAAGSVRILNQGLTVRVDRGRIYDSAFSDGLAQVPDLWDVESMHIHGQIRGPFGDGLRALGETPLSSDFAQLAQTLSVRGQSHLALDIDLPFEQDKPLAVAGRLSWPAPASLGILGTQIELSDLAGEVRFNAQRLAAQSVTGTLWGRPVELAIATEGEGDPKTSITRIRARAQTSVKTLAERFPAESWQFLDGTLDWALVVTLNNRDVSQQNPPLAFDLSSQLRGLALDMPRPLGKSADTARALALNGTLVPGQSLTLAGHLGELGANLVFDLAAGAAEGLSRGRLRLGEPVAPEPDVNGLMLDGAVAELDLPAWTHWIQAAAAQAPASASASVLTGVELDVERLLLGGASLTDAALSVTPQSGGWQVGVRARELAGQVYIAPEGDARPLEINLQRLDLKALSMRPDREERQETQAATGADIAGLDRLPSLDLRATELRWGEALLGSLDLALRQDNSGLRLAHIKVAGPGVFSLQGEGAWIRTGDDGRSRIDLLFETQDLGRLLGALDDRKVLDASEASAMVTLGWRGALNEFALRRADGAIDLRVGQGRFLDVEPGVGRVLGFLNVGALGRRLALDFSDLYAQGFAFEQIVGRIAIGQAKARFDDFLIDGTAGKVMVSGSTDLIGERFDQRITVEPKVGSSIALASAVAGGPVIGAAVYLVDKVAGNPIDRLARYQYRVTGPWNDPVMTRMGWEPLANQRRSAGSGTTRTDPEPPKNHFLDVQ